MFHCDESGRGLSRLSSSYYVSSPWVLVTRISYFHCFESCVQVLFALHYKILPMNGISYSNFMFMLYLFLEWNVSVLSPCDESLYNFMKMWLNNCVLSGFWSKLLNLGFRWSLLSKVLYSLEIYYAHFLSFPNVILVEMCFYKSISFHLKKVFESFLSILSVTWQVSLRSASMRRNETPRGYLVLFFFCPVFLFFWIKNSGSMFA